MIFCKNLNFVLILTIILPLLISVNDAANASGKQQDPKCLMPKEPGPCRMKLERYYYNAETDTCETFTFGGCRGNDNKFGFKQTCEAACKKATNTGTSIGKVTSTTTTRTPQMINKQLKSDTLKSLTANGNEETSTKATTITTPKTKAAQTTPKVKSSSPTPLSGTTRTSTTPKSNFNKNLK